MSLCGLLRRVPRSPLLQLSIRGYATNKLNIVNPATTEIIDQVDADTPQTVVSKAALAKQAQLSWRNVPLSERISIINQYKELLLQEVDTLGATLSQETGKPLSQAKGEVKGTCDRIDYFCNNIAAVLKPEQLQPRGGVDEHFEYDPIGVIGNISAWNYPYFVGHNVIIPGLLTGNSVLYKPSEYSTLTGLHIARLLNKLCIPNGTFQTIVGTGEVGAALLTESDSKGERLIDAIFFTGSNATGSKIAELAGKRLIRTQLELGGKDGVYVHDDVSIDYAAENVAEGILYNNGQGCCSLERVYVNEKIYDKFLERVVHFAKQWKLGNPFSSETNLGPLTRPQQAKILDQQVADAVAKGAKVLLGGKATQVESLKGVYYEPTIIANCNNSMLVMQDESFGPIAGIQSISGDVNAIVDALNDCKYGLTNAVYSKDANVAHSILSKVNSGTVYWNSCDRVSPQLPWSGRKGSGVGSTLGAPGILAFVQPKAYHYRKV